VYLRLFHFRFYDIAVGSFTVTKLKQSPN